LQTSAKKHFAVEQKPLPAVEVCELNSRYNPLIESRVQPMNKKKQTGQQKSDADLKRRGAKIGDQLRRIYEDVAQEDVPDEFLKLLEQADKKRSSGPADSE
jgi:hypothetical protein